MGAPVADDELSKQQYRTNSIMQCVFRKLNHDEGRRQGDLASKSSVAIDYAMAQCEVWVKMG
jgi:hypothetical protein